MGTFDQVLPYLARFREDAWSPPVRRRAELCLLDSLACYSAGRYLPQFAPSAAVAGKLFGSSGKNGLSAFGAAYLYGQAANALDYDDTMLIGHPGAPIIGAVIAIAARERLSVDRLLRGIAAGYECEMILNGSAAPSRERAANVRSVGVWDTVGGAVGAGVALGFDDQALERLVGVAVAHSLLPYTAKWYERPAPGVKNNMGWAAAGAVLAVDLAQAGQTGITNPLDGEAGMWRMAGSDHWSLDLGLLSKPAVLRTGFKHYPVCWHLQEWLKVLAKLLLSLGPDDDVAEIIVTAPRDMEKFCPREYFGPVDIATHLPVACSFLVSGVEPGVQWGSLDGRERDLRYVAAFRYECAGIRTLTLRTRDGRLMHADVPESEFVDRAVGCLDEQGVLAKQARLCDSELLAATANLRAGESDEREADPVPEQLYRAIDRSMALAAG